MFPPTELQKARFAGVTLGLSPCSCIFSGEGGLADETSISPGQLECMQGVVARHSELNLPGMIPADVAASPVACINFGGPPILLVHGSDDPVISIARSANGSM